MNSDDLDASTPAQNAWVRTVRSDELSASGPLKVTPGGHAIVLYRKLDGAPVALEDSCPHRWAPLSDGHIEGDNIVCPYHGFKFCPQGHLVTTSGKPSTPGVSSAKVFQVMERDETIWIWVGSEEPGPRAATTA
jgi:phenylpropionate dioxygenase-like ring-hydroxylating dioxygenase large terminal subunit